MLATFYMDKDDEMYEKYCLKAANQGENIAKKSLAIFYAKNNNEEKMLEWYNKLDDKEDYDVLAYMSNYYMFQDNYDKVKEINFTILKNTWKMATTNCQYVYQKHRNHCQITQIYWDVLQDLK